jgi:hypothetical protein
MMNVYFTVDTESSMGGAWRHAERRPLSADRHVFCRIDGRDYGIGLITDALARFGFRATHFVEMLATLVNGEPDTQAVFDYLLSRNQDVQLHIHPTYRFYANLLQARARGQQYQPPASNDWMTSFPEARQMELLEEASGLFERFAGKRPIAFRAGCFAANRTTLRCLRKLNIVLDTSFNPCFPACSFPGGDLPPNRVSMVENVWEIPVSVARTPIPESAAGFKIADPCSLSIRELRTMLEIGASRGQSHFVIVFHSFAAVKPRDETYARMRPDWIVIRRLEKLAAYIASRTDLYRVSTFQDLSRELPLTEDKPLVVAELGFVGAGLRKTIQGMNRFYWL